jgi:hypothetical protein
VVSLGAGSTVLNRLVDQAARAGTHLTADLRRTRRNRMMEVAYRRKSALMADQMLCTPEQLDYVRTHSLRDDDVLRDLRATTLALPGGHALQVMPEEGQFRPGHCPMTAGW